MYAVMYDRATELEDYALRNLRVRFMLATAVFIMLLAGAAYAAKDIDSNPAQIKQGKMYESLSLVDGSGFSFTDYTVWVTGKSMCPPDCSSGWAVMRASIKPSDLELGDTICWQLKPDQIERFWQVSRAKVNQTRLAQNLALGLPTPQKSIVTMWTACHALIWRNETNFITQGTNQKYNLPYPPDDFGLTFKRNYIGRLDYD